MNQISDFITLSQKILSVIGSILYLVFSLVIVKQTTSMSRYIVDKFNFALIVFSYAHLIFSILLVILTLTVL